MSTPCERVFASAPPLSPELEAHAHNCARCQEVLALRRALGHVAWADAGEAPDASKALAELKARPRRSPAWRAPALLALVNGAAAGAAAAMLSRHGLVNNAASLGVIAAVAVGLGLLALGGAVAGAGGGRGALWLAGGAVLVALVAVVGRSGLGGEGPFAGGVHCLEVEVLFSLLPAAMALWVLRASAYRPGKAFAAGAAAGAGVLLALHLHCPNGTAAHLVAFHLAPWLFLAGLVVVIRRALPSWSFAP